MKCKICNKEFKNKGISSHILRIHNISIKDYYDKYLKKEDEGFCPICGKKTSFISLFKGYRVCCSKFCAAHYGLLAAQNKYNVVNISQVPEIKNKMKESIKASWENLNEDDYIKRCNNISIGTKNSNCIINKQENIKKIEQNYNCTHIKTIFKLYGSGWFQQNIINIIKIGSYRFVSNDDIPIIKKYYEQSNKVSSLYENYIFNKISENYNKQIIQNTKLVITPYELDIYLPEISLAIEFNGLYYHSIENNKSKDYHLNKSLLCREKGIRLIHIYEFENLKEQTQLLKDLILGIDNYPKNDFNKNNFIKNIPNPELLINQPYHVYGSGFLYNKKGNIINYKWKENIVKD